MRLNSLNLAAKFSLLFYWTLFRNVLNTILTSNSFYNMYVFIYVQACLPRLVCPWSRGWRLLLWLYPVYLSSAHLYYWRRTYNLAFCHPVAIASLLSLLGLSKWGFSWRSCQRIMLIISEYQEFESHQRLPFLKQGTLLLLLGTGWFKEWI